MKLLLPLIIFTGLLVGAYYYIFNNNDWKAETKSNIFTSDSQSFLENLTDNEINKKVFYDLPEKTIKPEFNGKIFCANRIFGSEKKPAENSMTIYVYAYCEEYYLLNDKVTLGTGVSYPLKLIYSVEKKSLVFDSIEYPQNGEEYANSIRKMFPKEYAQEAIGGMDVSKMAPLPINQAENYYKGKLDVYF